MPRSFFTPFLSAAFLALVAYAMLGIMEIKNRKEVPPEIVKRFCEPPVRVGEKPEWNPVSVFKDKDGNIGGYSAQRTIGDSPVYYFDAEGKGIAMFHIFDSDEEKAKANEIIKKLTERFPVEETLDCGETSREENGNTGSTLTIFHVGTPFMLRVGESVTGPGLTLMLEYLGQREREEVVEPMKFARLRVNMNGVSTIIELDVTGKGSVEDIGNYRIFLQSMDGFDRATFLIEKNEGPLE